MMADERGRVPFAIAGVVLLVASATIAATSGPTGPASDPAVENTLDRATATVNSEVRGAVQSAAAEAATSPVITPANTSMGAALNESRPFRDSLRVRIYAQARERVADVDRRRVDVRVTASLPPTPNGTALRGAIERVDLDRADGNGTAIRVRVQNVTLTARRDGAVLTRRTISPNVTVATPVLEMHDRVDTYERRLDAPVTEPGLSRRMNAQLMAVAWTRGWAQNQGAPIDNVVATRHVSLAANAGALDVQRTTIGHVDSDGLEELRYDALTTGGEDLLAGLETPAGSGHVTGEAADRLRAPPSEDITVFDPPETPGRDDEMTVGVNRSADDAFLAYEGRGLEDTIQAVYMALARPVVRVTDERGTRPVSPDSPGPEYELVEERLETSGSVESVEASDPPEATGEWERIDAYARDVAVEYERVAVWSNGNETTETSSTSTVRGTATVGITMRLGDDSIGPFGDVDLLYEPDAGPLGGSNLYGIQDRAVDEVLDEWGGRDGIAERAVTDDPDWSPIRIAGDPPEGIREYVLADVNDVRRDLRSENVTVERGAVAGFAADPHGRLADRVVEREESFVDPPERFDSVADRARIAARSAYLNWTVDRLRTRSNETTRVAETVNDEMVDEGSGSLSDLQHGVRATHPNRGARYPTLRGPGGPVRLRVDSSPPYLPANRELDAEEYPSLEEDTYAMTTRNVNHFAISYGEVTDGLVDAVRPAPERSRLDTAARTLRSANRTLDRSSPENLSRQRRLLGDQVLVRTEVVKADVVQELSEQGVGENRGERVAVVEDGLDRWPSVAGRALALSNGSAAGPIARQAANDTDLDPYEVDHLRLRLDRRMRESVTEGRAKPPRRVVNQTAEVTRAVVGDVVDDAAAEVLNRTGRRTVAAATNETVDQLPAGLPVVPLPGYWYVTTNSWSVTVRGEYERFGVRANSADPRSPGGEVAYVRDGSNSTLDVDGDGDEETLGRSTEVDFEAHAFIAVVVPPNPRGVGDTDGVRNETSAGWPNPGPN